MAILSGPEILTQVHAGNLIIRPFSETNINPNSVDVHLGDKLMEYSYFNRVEIIAFHGGRELAIDSKNPPELEEVLSHAELGGWLLLPNRLYLGTTLEYTETHGFVPYIDGRSSLGRLGVFCHVTAGRGDNGFIGHWTLEFAVVEPVILYPGQRIAQLTYHTIEGEPVKYGETRSSYAKKHRDTKGPVPAAPIDMD